MMKVNYFEISRIPTVDAKKVLATIEDDELHPGRKRRRLDNLNVEERILRRKLKNRVAAQTARDRKKQHMDELEITLSRMEKENKFLKKSNEQLRSQVHNLTESNLLLRSKLGLTPPASPSQEHTCLTVSSKNENDLIITPSVSDHDHIVIKKEELLTEYASLRVVSLLWNLTLTILVSLITICETSHRLNYCWTFWETKNQFESKKQCLQKQSQLELHVKPPDIPWKPFQQDQLQFVMEVSSKKNLMLMNFYHMKIMRLYAHQAQSLLQRHLNLALEAWILMILSRCAPKQRVAWWGTQPLMDVG
ncbi:X-box-binding protein 1-like [Hydractinia symbiolongicarpus]|uniref:X-box-binding protein 1-like n=1 Tax=Hydractinia symbiolongicarpus TaxID=13093 RepID=UPI00254EFA77|nr:X-box-binding protein 1-like [Hydractinia symbiolongicarpus]